jgi:hypothetical protein
VGVVHGADHLAYSTPGAFVGIDRDHILHVAPPSAPQLKSTAQRASLPKLLDRSSAVNAMALNHQGGSIHRKKPN